VARGEADVSLVARGDHLSSIRKNGLKVITPDDEFTVSVPATDAPSDLGTQDVVFLAAKAHGLTAAAEALQPLLGPDTIVVSAQNGIPFWYFHAHSGNFDGHVLQPLIPAGRLPPRSAISASLAALLRPATRWKNRAWSETSATGCLLWGNPMERYPTG